MDQANFKLEVRENGKHGQGVFALEDIAAGSVVMTFTGRRVSIEECARLVAEDATGNDDSFQIDLDKYFILDPLSFKFNHSCDPSVGFRKESEMFALRDIKAGEEITYDYSAVVAPNITEDLWTMECSCGSAICRGTVANVLSLPPETRKKYFELGAFQDYMLDYYNLDLDQEKYSEFKKYWKEKIDEIEGDIERVREKNSHK